MEKNEKEKLSENMQINTFKNFIEGYVNVHNEMVGLDISDKSKEIERQEKIIEANDALIQNYLETRQLKRMANGNMKEIDVNNKQEHIAFEVQTKQYMENIKKAEAKIEQMKKQQEENIKRKEQLENVKKNIREHAKKMKEEKIEEEKNDKTNYELPKMYVEYEKQEEEIQKQLEKFKSIELETTKQEVERIALENELRQVRQSKEAVKRQMNQKSDRSKIIEKQYILFLGQLSLIDKEEQKIEFPKENVANREVVETVENKEKAAQENEKPKKQERKEESFERMTKEDLQAKYIKEENKLKEALKEYGMAKENGASEEKLAKMLEQINNQKSRVYNLFNQYKTLEKMVEGREKREEERYNETIKEAMKDEMMKQAQEDGLLEKMVEGREKREEERYNETIQEALQEEKALEPMLKISIGRSGSIEYDGQSYQISATDIKDGVRINSNTDKQLEFYLKKELGIKEEGTIKPIIKLARDGKVDMTIINAIYATNMKMEQKMEVFDRYIQEASGNKYEQTEIKYDLEKLSKGSIWDRLFSKKTDLEIYNRAIMAQRWEIADIEGEYNPVKSKIGKFIDKIFGEKKEALPIGNRDIDTLQEVANRYNDMAYTENGEKRTQRQIRKSFKQALRANNNIDEEFEDRIPDAEMKELGNLIKAQENQEVDHGER